ncbi:MerR family transcriptional regulator [Thalassolituus marinus]|uniref:MerR family transcriptional regulator n=1 Tax=Thalassolituus marinus TaxID=671053 RepID=A0ABS7ZR74_9GAMM|nr:MerR family transcriptional regulator [Thalassolituus marinus]MCA6064213.1 MerR family transcriptional regulator [Thalassolituus marinus]
MKIGELAEATGLAASRIRFYEKIGLLRSVHRQSNGYRSYPPEAVTFLQLITSAQQAGFTLDELRALLPADLSQWDHGSLVDAMRTKLADIEALQQRLAVSRAQLLEVLHEIESKPADMNCADNARRVLTQFGMGDIKNDKE